MVLLLTHIEDRSSRPLRTRIWSIRVCHRWCTLGNNADWCVASTNDFLQRFCSREEKMVFGSSFRICGRVSVHFCLLQCKEREDTILGHSLPHTNVCGERDHDFSIFCSPIPVVVCTCRPHSCCGAVPCRSSLHDDILSYVSSQQNSRVALDWDPEKMRLLMSQKKARVGTRTGHSL